MAGIQEMATLVDNLWNKRSYATHGGETRSEPCRIHGVSTSWVGLPFNVPGRGTIFGNKLTALLFAAGCWIIPVLVRSFCRMLHESLLNSRASSGLGRMQDVYARQNHSASWSNSLEILLARLTTLKAAQIH